MADLPSIGNLSAAKRIDGALDNFNLKWIEDPVFMKELEKVGHVAASTQASIIVGKLLGERARFCNLLEQGVSLAIAATSRGDGLARARKVIALADTCGRPSASHDCTGPIALSASADIMMYTPRVFYIRDSTRSLSWLVSRPNDSAVAN